jgi:hypothetical protein
MPLFQVAVDMQPFSVRAGIVLYSRQEYLNRYSTTMFLKHFNWHFRLDITSFIAKHDKTHKNSKNIVCTKS